MKVFVEHVIRLVKSFRVASDLFRLNINKYESLIYTICGLVRLRALILEVSESGDGSGKIEINQYHIWSALLTGTLSNPDAIV